MMLKMLSDRDESLRAHVGRDFYETTAGRHGVVDRKARSLAKVPATTADCLWRYVTDSDFGSK